jgi:hypothetical protein
MERLAIRQLLAAAGITAVLIFAADAISGLPTAVALSDVVTPAVWIALLLGPVIGAAVFALIDCADVRIVVLIVFGAFVGLILQVIEIRMLLPEIQF